MACWCNRVKILADRHHSDLLYGLQRLFEDRLGYELYVPLGREWWDEGYWRFGAESYGDDRMARQFLEPDAAYREVEPGLWLTFDPHHPYRVIYGVSLERARVGWDLVLCSVQDNQAGFVRFAHEAGAKYLYHVGNARQQIDWSLEPYVLNTSEASIIGRGVNIGQEFDHTTTFRYRPPIRAQRIVSFVNLLPLIPEAVRDYDALTLLLPEYEFRSFGHDCPDGYRRPVAAIADEMARAGWAYHDKPTGDGFGHIIHNWAAVGRPLIGHARYYAGQRAEPLWQDLTTCIDLDKHTLPEAAEIIGGLSATEHEAMCANIRRVFDSIYDPEEDARRVRDLLR